MRLLLGRLRASLVLIKREGRRGIGPLVEVITRLTLAAFGRRSALNKYHRILPSGLVTRTLPRTQRRVYSGQWRAPLIRTGFPVRAADGVILHLVGRSLPHFHSGYTIRTQATLEGQRRVGLHPEAVTQLGFPWSVGSHPTRSEEPVNGIRYWRLGEGQPPRRLDKKMSENMRSLRRVLEQTEPSVLHAHSDFLNGLLAVSLGEQFGLPVVYEVRGFWEETWLSKSPERKVSDDQYRWRRERELECMVRADHVITLSETMRARILGDGIDPEKVSVVPNAVDPADFPVTDGRDVELAASLGIDDADFVVGYISSLVPYEGIDTLIHALARISNTSTKCLIVGDGESAHALRDRAVREGVENTMIFTGRVPHESIHRYYSLLDVFVVPRKDVSVCRLVQPLKPFEALSSGLPLVVSDVPALSNLARNSGGGLVFRPDDADDLGRTLLRLRDDPALRDELGECGANWVREHHTWDHNASRYQEVYKRIGSGATT